MLLWSPLLSRLYQGLHWSGNVECSGGIQGPSRRHKSTYRHIFTPMITEISAVTLFGAMRSLPAVVPA